MESTIIAESQNGNASGCSSGICTFSPSPCITATAICVNRGEHAVDVKGHQANADDANRRPCQRFRQRQPADLQLSLIIPGLAARAYQP